MRYVMGLDLSLNKTGLVVMGLKGVVDTFAISSATRGNDVKTGRSKKIKLLGLQRQVNTVNIVEKFLHNWNVEEVGIENYSFASQGNAVYQLAELGGMIRHLLWRMNIPFQTFSPQTVKKFLVGHLPHLKRKPGKMTKKEKAKMRKASKLAMVSEAHEQIVYEDFYPLDKDKQLTDDEADAFSIAKLKLGIGIYKSKHKVHGEVEHVNRGVWQFNENQFSVVKKWARVKREKQQKLYDLTNLL